MYLTADDKVVIRNCNLLALILKRNPASLDRAQRLCRANCIGSGKILIIG